MDLFVKIKLDGIIKKSKSY